MSCHTVVVSDDASSSGKRSPKRTRTEVANALQSTAAMLQSASGSRQPPTLENRLAAADTPRFSETVMPHNRRQPLNFSPQMAQDGELLEAAHTLLDLYRTASGDTPSSAPCQHPIMPDDKPNNSECITSADELRMNPTKKYNSYTRQVGAVHTSSLSGHAGRSPPEGRQYFVFLFLICELLISHLHIRICALPSVDTSGKRCFKIWTCSIRLNK